MDAKVLVEKYRNELIEKLAKLVNIESVYGEAEEGAPFGKGPKEALLTALDMLDQDGFKTVNLDNYVGYAEMGEGDDIIGIIGHLDVVPAKKEDGWDTDPFAQTEKDGILYGRGVSDDKGAVVASMIAMKVIRDLEIPLNKRIRLIMGTNEESGSKCLEYYVKKEGDVTYGFTPDGDFPGVYGEKGMIKASYHSLNTNILDIEGGSVSNIVCSKCTIKVEKNSYSPKTLKEYFNQKNLTYSIEEGTDSDTITVLGVAAHASLPHLGVNAISELFMALKRAGYQDLFVDFYCSHFGLETDGSLFGAACKDEYGALTSNNGVIRMKDGVITGTIDMRSPVSMNVKQVVRQMQEENKLKDEGGEIVIERTVDPLFYPPESTLVTSLLKAYRDVTGDTETEPMTIGGGTYAKEIGNTIAFGCAFPGKDYRIHNVNEWVEIDELLLQAEIYVQAIINLLNV